MKLRRYIIPCPEGVYFIAVLGFIVGGALLREINLLVILAGMMAGPIVVSVFVSLANVRRLSFNRVLPETVFAGEVLSVEIEATNPHPRRGAWAVVVEDHLLAAAPALDTRAVSAELVFPYVAAGKSAALAYRVRVVERGEYRLGPLHVSTRFPLSLFRAHRWDEAPEKVLVLPRLGTLTPRWRSRIAAEQAGGRFSSRRRGSAEGEFFGLRDWRSGDNRKAIHWRTSARLGRLTVRQYEQRRSIDLTIVVDLWRTSAPSRDDLARIETVLSFAATIVADACRQGGCRLTLLVVGGEISCQQGNASFALEHELLCTLARAKSGPAHSPEALRNLVAQKRDRNSQCVILTSRIAPLPVHEHKHQAGSEASLAEALALRGAATVESPTTSAAATGAIAGEGPALVVRAGSSEMAEYFQWES